MLAPQLLGGIQVLLLPVPALALEGRETQGVVCSSAVWIQKMVIKVLQENYNVLGEKYYLQF